MKNISSEIDDSLRPEYKRSDFRELVRGKYAVSQVEFAQLVHLLLSCIGEDEDAKFIHHSIGNYVADHKPGDWTYEIDNANQVTLHYWRSGFTSVEEVLSNPTTVMTPKDRAELQSALLEGVTNLKTKVAALKD
jgi:hypothetical protein